ncbi:MAG: hypothetical protein WCK35_12235 [Chloroflexota bacterium]
MLRPRSTPGAETLIADKGWRLQIPTGQNQDYRLSQLDNTNGLERRNFPLKSSGNLRLRCRASQLKLPGTWGFGFWNDPFAFSLGLQGMSRRLPVLPNACWFFYSSPENHLSFQNNLPASGFLAQTFRSPKIPSSLMLPAALGAPLLYWKNLSRYLRKLAGKVVIEDSLQLNLDPTDWHNYQLDWNAKIVTFQIDQSIVFQTSCSPHGPLGCVIWIDNQYAAWKPDGGLSAGNLPIQSNTWLELEDLEISGTSKY